jgi:hypothetical protein
MKLAVTPTGDKTKSTEGCSRIFSKPGVVMLILLHTPSCSKVPFEGNVMNTEVTSALLEHESTHRLGKHVCTDRIS